VLKNIILVDDDIKIAELSGQSLSNKGHNVKIFNNPLEVITFLTENEDFNIVITDNIMPELNGYDLIKETLSLRPELRFILATGDSPEDFDLTSFENRVVIVSKPFRRKQLLEAIENIDA
jgi:DNA-binding NtrC family response regulator